MTLTANLELIHSGIGSSRTAGSTGSSQCYMQTRHDSSSSCAHIGQPYAARESDCGLR